MTQPNSSLYQNYKYRLVWNGRTVAAFDRAKNLPTSSSLTPHSSPLTLEQGVTHDRDFVDWANAVADYENLPREGVSLTELRQELTFEASDQSGLSMQSYIIHRCWVSEFQIDPNPNAPRRTLAIISLTLENDGISLSP